MSRIIIKGLNRKTSDIHLHRVFSQYGKITDIKIFKNKIGETRGFCFIGFSTLDSAKMAIENMNGGVLENKKIIIEEALPRFNEKLKKESLILYHKNFKSSLFNSHLSSFKLYENISETGILFIRNIPKTCKNYELESLFKNFGYIEYVNIPFKKEKKEKYFSICAYIKFGLPECAITAAAYLDGKIFQGRIIHIISGYNYTSNIYTNKNDFSFNIFKKIKNKLNYEISSNHKSWFLLFIPGDIIIKNLVSKLGYAKNLLSDYKHLKINSGKNTITEGRIQNEAFLILKKEGLNLSYFDPNLINYKSRRIILIKNLPVHKKKTLYLLLKKFGNILKYVILPLTGLVIVEFKKRDEALLAYRSLEKFTNEEGNVLLIQWAPLGCFKSTHLKKDQDVAESKKKNSILPLNKNENNKYLNYSEKFYFRREKNVKNYKLLIKNIPFSANSKDLTRIFYERNKLVSIRIPKKKNGSNRGFCFVEFCTLEDAKKALVLLQNVHYEKRRLFLSIVD